MQMILQLEYVCVDFIFFFKQKTAYEMRISDWSSDVCSSDLDHGARQQARQQHDAGGQARRRARDAAGQLRKQGHALVFSAIVAFGEEDERMRPLPYPLITVGDHPGPSRIAANKR